MTLGQIGHNAPVRRNGPVAVEVVGEDVIEPNSLGYSGDVMH